MDQSREVNKIYRDNFSLLVTSLVSYFGLKNIEIAEDLVQDTFEAALISWKKEWPSDPKSWLFKVCKRKTINYLNKHANKAVKQSLYESSLSIEAIEHFFLPDEIKDNQLRLLFAFCNPNLSIKSQVAITLRILIGLTPNEISNGLGIKLEATKKLLSRAKQKIRQEGIQLRVPHILQSHERIRSVHKTIYLIFNEGYNTSNGEKNIRHDLCFEAIGLTKSLLISKKMQKPETSALMALMLFNLARFESRISQNGEIIELNKQDRTKWDQQIINAAFNYLMQSKNEHLLTSYHIEAAIASIHCSSPSFEDTDWCTILKLYENLIQINDSPFTKLNYSIALGYCKSIPEALTELTSIELAKHLNQNHFYHVTLGKFYHKLKDLAKARKHFATAHRLTKVSVERNYIESLMDHYITNPEDH